MEVLAPPGSYTQYVKMITFEIEFLMMNYLTSSQCCYLKNEVLELLQIIMAEKDEKIHSFAKMRRGANL